MINSCNSFDSAELAAAINAVASMMAKDKCIEEIEIMALAFDMLSDTLFAIALMQKKQERLREHCERECLRRDDTV
ncbi:MAG: hypothetical protein FWD34_05245 [Oscillospiraceae bacterium]|nr:hypothetical protein [Oscillospiraceae bacterium]